jgi:cytochrome c peroxidase
LVTQPYFHDGSQATLWDIVDHYNKGGIQNPFLDGGITRLGLTEPEIDDLVTFLFALTSDRYEPLAKKELARQRALSRTSRPQRDTVAATTKNPSLKQPLGDIAPNPTLKDPSRIGGR